MVVDDRRSRSAVAVEGLGYLLRRGGRSEPGHDLAVGVDEELLEVPGDVGTVALAGLFGLEPLVERFSAVAVHLDLVEHRERHAELRRGELEDLLVRSGLLSCELVAGKSEDGDVVVVVMKRTQTCVLRREASSAGDVDDQADLPAELVEGDLLAGDRGHLEIVEG
jgi:hypothetical protein